jgi:DNA repair protein RecN (Recombination protein N)
MLTRLSITNYALIRQTDIVFGPGLTIMTGETGAGKSLIVGAISTLVGEKISTDVIGQDRDHAVVEGEFDISAAPDICELLNTQGIDSGDTLLLRREITPKRTRGLINDQVASLAQLKAVTEKLLDLHGQHDHQSLLHRDLHLDFLDGYGGHIDLVMKMQRTFQRHHSLLKELRSLEEQLTNLREIESLHRHELELIQKVNPEPEEDETLEQEAHQLEHAEEYHRYTYEILELLHNSDQSILANLDEIQRKLEHLKALDHVWDDIFNDTQSAATALKEIARFAQDYHHRIEFAPERLDQIRERLQSISTLKRRFGGTLESVIARAELLKTELQESEETENRISRLKPELEHSLRELRATAIALSNARRKSAKPLATSVKQLLSRVGISSAQFEVGWQVGNDKQPDLPGIRGSDVVEFQLSTNPGEPLKSLVQVASGGEISRVMLALKAALADSGGTYTMVFDEIDNGISGRIARQVGKVLLELARHRQIIVVTHLPQIASLGQLHLKVSKRQVKDKTVTEVMPLDAKDRVEEIASLMAGAQVTDQVRASARELLTNLN